MTMEFAVRCSGVTPNRYQSNAGWVDLNDATIWTDYVAACDWARRLTEKTTVVGVQRIGGRYEDLGPVEVVPTRPLEKVPNLAVGFTEGLEKTTINANEVVVWLRRALSFQKRSTQFSSSSGKYGSLDAFAAKLRPGEPWFVLRAQDKLSITAIDHYLLLLDANGLAAQSAQLRAFRECFKAWQKSHPDLVKLPD